MIKTLIFKNALKPYWNTSEQKGHFANEKNDRRFIPLIGIILIIGFLTTSLASYFASGTSLRLEISENQLPLTGDNIMMTPMFILQTDQR